MVNKRIRMLGLGLLVGGLLLAGAIEAFFVEPDWIKIRPLSINSPSTIRLVHISDLHYKGDQTYLLPLIGALVAPFAVGRYQNGLYSTPAGPLHVSCHVLISV